MTTRAEREARNAEIVRLRTEEGLWPFEIAEKCGLSRQRVRMILIDAGLGMGARGEPMPPGFAAARAARLREANARAGRKTRVREVAELIRQKYPRWMIGAKLRISNKLVEHYKYRAKKQGLL